MSDARNYYIGEMEDRLHLERAIEEIDEGIMQLENLRAALEGDRENEGHKPHACLSLCDQVLGKAFKLVKDCIKPNGAWHHRYR